LTHYEKDDGQEISEIVFSPDGNFIAFVRGGPKNSAGEIPNPTSDAAGAKQEVWVANARTAAMLRLGEGEHPIFSRQGNRVVYSRDRLLWMGSARGGGERKMFEIRGQVSSPSWSPDGSQLLFVSQREDHSFITVFDTRGSKLRFIQPSVDRDIAPRWSPDGRRIAFVRLFNVANTPSANREILRPWAIRVANAQTGKGWEVWKSGSSEMDSYPNYPSGNVLEWVAGNRLLFSSEKDGWFHLYAIRAPESNDGEPAEPIALTNGDYEVENTVLSADRSYALIATNEGDIDRRHLWRIDFVETSRRDVSTHNPPDAAQITRGDGVEIHPVIAGGGKQIAFLHSTARDPFLPYVASADGSGARPLAPQALPSDFPAAQLVQPEQVVFKSGDGTTVHGQLFKSRDASGKKPAVVFMHGGPPRQMLLGWHYMYYYHNSYAFNQYLASRDYVVLSVNYRSGIGYGRAFREARHRGARGASEYQDIVAAGKYLRSLPDVDGKRIGLWGGSYGGYLTALGLARDSELFAAGVDFHGVHDWSARVGRAPAASSADLIKLGRESSPISSVDKWRSPVLLIHGDDDRNVAFNQTVELVRKLREQGVQFEQLIFPDEVHDFLRHDRWLQAYHAAADFLDRQLK
jgi:dipeptidyl aminopeptidase/acylaminoacyl peptidase